MRNYKTIFLYSYKTKKFILRNHINLLKIVNFVLENYSNAKNYNYGKIIHFYNHPKKMKGYIGLAIPVKRPNRSSKVRGNEMTGSTKNFTFS